MINFKQLNRLVLKIVRLKDVYLEYMITDRDEQQVLIDGNPIKKGDCWGTDFSYANFTFTYKGGFENPYLFVDNGGVEHLLSANGTPFGMADYLPNGKDAIFRCHKYISLKSVPIGSLINVETYASHTFYGTMPFEKKQTFSVNGYRPERVYNGIYVVNVNATIKTFIENLELLTSYFRCMDEDDVRKSNAYKIYEKLFDLLTVFPETAPVDSQLERANAIMDEFFNSLKGGSDDNLPYVGIIGHSHLDTAWLWTVEETHHKAIRTVSNALTLLKEYPEYKFIMSSVLYLDWIKKEYPVVFEQIKELTVQGKFEPNGASWVECDCNITDGESMIRQFVRGKKFLKENFNYDADVFWLPDTFGYSPALPQIMKGCGVSYFLTTKLSWNDTNRFPYDSFRWVGMDGSDVVVHFNTTHSKADPEFITSRLQKRLNKHLTKNVLIAYGYGDGGGGPAREMVENAIKTEKSYPYAKVEHTTVSNFMKRLEKEELPEYWGELYLELHRGTLTTNHQIKQLNRKFENCLKDAEIVSVARGKSEDKQLINGLWDVLMLNQFHDILPGTCIYEAHKKAIEENTKAISEINELFKGDNYYNTLSFERTEILPCQNGIQTYLDLDGNEVSIDAYTFPAFGYGKKKEAPKNAFGVSENGEIVTPYYNAKISAGEIVSLVYKGREIVKTTLNSVKMYEDVPYLWDNWDVDADYERKKCQVTVIDSEILSVGQLELRIRSKFKLGESSILTQDMIFSAISPIITFENKLEWDDHHKFVKVDFDTNVFTNTYKSEIQFGYIDRSSLKNTSEDQAKYEVCNHKWTDVSEPKFGVAILNDCKYGVSVSGGKIGLSLLKSGKRPDAVGEVGTKYFRYAILPHEGAFTAESVTLPAYAFNRTPVKVESDCNFPVKSISTTNVILETAKFADNGKDVVLRLYESERSLTSCIINFADEYEIYECNMLEENESFIGKSEKLLIDFKPFEIKTLLLKK